MSADAAPGGVLLSITVDGEPVSWKRAIPIGRGRVIQDPAAKKQKTIISMTARNALPPTQYPYVGDVDVTIVFVFSAGVKYARADLDRHVNLVLDALTGIVYDDDRRVRSIHAWKVEGTTPETRITVVKS